MYTDVFSVCPKQMLLESPKVVKIQTQSFKNIYIWWNCFSNLSLFYFLATVTKALWKVILASSKTKLTWIPELQWHKVEEPADFEAAVHFTTGEKQCCCRVVQWSLLIMFSSACKILTRSQGLSLNTHARTSSDTVFLTANCSAFLFI